MTRSLWFQRELFLKNIFAPFNRLWLVLLSAERKCIGIKNKLPWLGRILSRDDNFWNFFRTRTSGTRTKTGTRMCEDVNFRKIVGRPRTARTSTFHGGLMVMTSYQTKEKPYKSQYGIIFNFCSEIGRHYFSE